MPHRIRIPIQGRGWPPAARSIALKNLGWGVLVAVGFQPWRGLEEAAASGLLFLAFMSFGQSRFSSILAEPTLGTIPLKGLSWVSVEIEGEGRARWLDPAGEALPLERDQAWNCWLSLLAQYGFPADAPPSLPRLRLDRASWDGPLPRRFLEDLPSERVDSKASRAPTSPWSFRMLVGLTLCSVVLAIALTARDPAFGLLGGSIPVLCFGAASLAEWRRRRACILAVRWIQAQQRWELELASGRKLIWSPDEVPSGPLRRLAISLSPRRAGALKTLDLFRDDLAHADWRAKRGRAIFTHSSLEQGSS